MSGKNVAYNVVTLLVRETTRDQKLDSKTFAENFTLHIWDHLITGE